MGNQGGNLRSTCYNIEELDELWDSRSAVLDESWHLARPEVDRNCTKHKESSSPLLKFESSKTVKNLNQTFQICWDNQQSFIYIPFRLQTV
jgi:hypothetical protein